MTAKVLNTADWIGKVRILTPKDTFTMDYPEAQALNDMQQGGFWPWFEVKVEKDKHDILVNMTEAERHGTIVTLKLFSLYEQIIGDDFWMNFVMKKFPRPGDIQPMAAMFAAIELAVHLKFYSKINEELGLATDEFYRSYLDDPVLKSRIDFLENTLASKDDLRALGTFTFGEGAILYVAFAFLKHFQASGKNKLLNVVSGINFSARDENLHAIASAWLFRTLKAELKEAGAIDEEYEAELEADIVAAALQVFEHEQAVTQKIFEKGPIEGITVEQLEQFSKSRIDLQLENMGYSPIFHVETNPIADWFYRSVTGYAYNDIFNSQGNQYQRGQWPLEAFTF